MNKLSKKEKDKLIERYENGYKKKPESINHIKAIEKASAEAFKEES